MYREGMFDNFSKEQLKELVVLINNFEGKDDLMMGLYSEIRNREFEEKQNLNIRFTIEMFKKYNMFNLDELRVLEINNIKNLQELIDCDLSRLIGITEAIKEKLDWARKFYDMNKSKKTDNVKRKVRK